MNVNSHRIAAAGRAAGTATVQKMRNIEQPSIRAASISSSGTASRRYWRMKNTPNAVTSQGRITAQMLPTQPSFGHHHEHRHHAELGRHRHRGDDERHQRGVAAEPQLGEGVAGQRGEAHDRGGGDRRDQQAVAERLPERHRVDDPLGVVEEVAAGHQRWGALGGDRRGVRAEQERPVERRRGAEHERDQQPVDEEAGPAVHRLTPSREAAGGQEVRQREDDDDQEQQPGDRRRLAEVAAHGPSRCCRSASSSSSTGGPARPRGWR